MGSILDKPMKSFDLSIRAQNCLLSADIKTLRELQTFVHENGFEGLLKFRNFGFKTTKELRELFKELGL